MKSIFVIVSLISMISGFSSAVKKIRTKGQAAPDHMKRGRMENIFATGNFQNRFD